MSRPPTRVHLAAATLVLALAASAAGAPPSSDTYRVRERIAIAGFYFSDDPSDCIQTTVSVSIAESVQRHVPSKQDPVAWGVVYIYRQDRCQDYRTLLSALGVRELQPGEIRFGGTLGSAGLNATFDLVDLVTNAAHTATVDLTWAATGPISQSKQRNSAFGPGFRYVSSLLGSERPAEAAGSVLLDSAEILSGRLSDDGSISQSRSGLISIYRY